MIDQDATSDPLEGEGLENEQGRTQPGNALTRLEVLRERIQERLLVTGLSARAASIKAGLGADAIRIIMDGRSTRPGFDRLEALAEVLQCDVQYLLGWTNEARPYRGRPQHNVIRLPVRDTLAAGRWRESAVLTAPSGRRDVMVIDALKGHDQWIEIIEDRSLDQIIPKGAFVRIVALRDLDHPLRRGDVVVVARTRSNHALRERTLRVVTVVNGYRYLELASTDAEIAHRLVLPDNDLSWPADVGGLRYMTDAEWDDAYESYAELAKRTKHEPIPKAARGPEHEFFGNVHIIGLAISAEVSLSDYE